MTCGWFRHAYRLDALAGTGRMGKYVAYRRYRKLQGMLLALLMPWLAHAAPVKVCAEAWPPFLYRDEHGRVSGMAADWIRQAAQHAGMQAQFQFLSLPACRKLAAAGAADALAFTPSLEQLEGWLPTREPMVFWVLTAFVPVESPHHRFRHLSQFNGQRVGWGQFYRYPDRLSLKQDWQRVTAFDVDAVFTLLLRGKVDVAFDDARYVAQTLSPHNQRRIRALQPVAAAMLQPVVVRPGLPLLAQALDAEAVKWRRTGQLDRFYRQQYHTPLATILAARD